MGRSSPSRLPIARGVAIAAAAGVLAGLVYANSLAGDFVWDDRPLILQSPSVQSFNKLDTLFVGDFFSHSQNPLPYGYYRPLTTLSYVLDWAVWGDNPFGFHATNVVLHVAATILVLLILLRLGLGEVPALVAACLFAVHPIHTESVAWISGRTDVLAFVFTAAALLAHLRSTSRPDRQRPTGKARGKKEKKSKERAPAHRPFRPLLVTLALFLFSAALLAKEMAAVLPFWVFLIATIHERVGWRRGLIRTLPFAVVVAAYGVARFVIVDVPAPAHPPSVTLGITLLSAPFTIVRYLWWMILPLDLNAYVQNPYVTAVADTRFWGSMVALTALTVGLVRLGRRCSEPLLLGSMLAVSFLPVLNFIRVASPIDMGNTMAERFCYFPSFPFVAMLVTTVPLLLPRARSRIRSVLTKATVLLLLVPAVASTWNRTRDWYDDTSLFTNTVGHAPEATLPWSQLALAHLRNGRAVEARRAMNKAARIDPDDLGVISIRTTLLVVEGKVQEAIPLQEHLVRASGPGRPVALNNLAYLYRVAGRTQDARRVLEQLVEDGNPHPDAWFNLAEVERQEGHLEQAVTAFERALELNPRDPRFSLRLEQVRFEYARALDRMNRRIEAIAQLQTVVGRTGDLELRRTAEVELERLRGPAADSGAGGSR